MISRLPFSLRDELPTRLTALEASAGTGKTHALSSLAARFVAERGVPSSGLCIVSFTEATTAELRSRVRSRLGEMAVHLDRCIAAGGPADTDDDVLDVVGHAEPEVVQARRRHVGSALAEFDAAIITTIHGFCRRVLAGSGSSSGDLDITDGAADVAEAVTDLLIARVGDDPVCPIRPDRLELAVRLQLSMPDAEMFRVPEDCVAPNDNHAEHQRYCDLAADIVDEACRLVQTRRTARRRRTFDGLLADTRALLSGPEGPTVVASLRQRLQVVLIDEFQDTDSVQWDIFRRAFVAPTLGEIAPAVVLVGDPKQSIYRFRSAELTAFLDAIASADQVATLPVNWRSDAPLLQALHELFDGFEFGSPEVAFQPVRAADHHQRRAITGAGEASLTLRWVGPDAEGVLDTEAARRQIQRDVVSTVGELLAGAADGTITVPGDDDEPRRLRPSDIAVLTRSNSDAATLSRRLGEAGIAAASASNESVIESDAATQWRRLLSALEQPGSGGRVRSAALSWFMGMRADELSILDERGFDELHDRLRAWSVDLATSGLPLLLTRLRAAGLHEHVLSRTGGERDLTDLDHIAELLLIITGGHPVSPTTLLARLADLERGVVVGNDDALASDVLARRIDRDDEAVQVLTIHKAKGLEFPVVLCPFLWSAGRSNGPPHAHLDGLRRINTPWVTDAPKAKWNQVVASVATQEISGEDRRLLYVALTRARHRCYVWWPTITTSGKGGPLGQLLAHAIGAEAAPSTADQLDVVADRSHGTFDVSEVEHRGIADPVTAGHAPNPDTDLAVATSTRRLDPSWRIWSFSAISAAAHPHDDHGRVEAVPLTGGTDEPALVAHAEVPAVPVAELSGGLRTVPGGTAFGTLVHEVLEHVDFASPQLRDDLLAESERRLRHRQLSVSAPTLADGLVDALGAPLGGPLGELRLVDVSRRDRLDELQFDLPLGRLRADRIGQVLVEHLDRDDPLRPWAERVADHGFEVDVRGMLTGSIDLVLRHDHRYVVADYKSNQLGREAAYDSAELVVAMEQHHYPLQAALYLVALHRYLRWRLPAYRPDVHLGGAAYLFVRGMDPRRLADDARGVFWWCPSPHAIDALDRLLAGDTS